VKNNQKEILSIAQEECAEVVQAISKIFRFGFDAHHPDQPDKTNKQRLEEELGDLQCMISLMIEFGIVDEYALQKAEVNKHAKLKRWSNIYEETTQVS